MDCERPLVLPGSHYIEIRLWFDNINSYTACCVVTPLNVLAKKISLKKTREQFYIVIFLDFAVMKAHFKGTAVKNWDLELYPVVHCHRTFL